MDWMSDCMQWTKCAKPFDQARIEFIGSEPFTRVATPLKTAQASNIRFKLVPALPRKL